MPDAKEKEIKKLKEALADERKRLAVVLQSIVDGVYITDTNRIITFWNDGAKRITGFMPRDVLGKSCRDILAHTDESGESLCDSSCPISETMGKKKAISGKDVLSGSVSGRMIPVSVSCSPIVEPDGRITGAIEVFRDISEQKQLERQRADFYSMITHDLKSPLQVIMGYSELMLSMAPDRTIKDMEQFLAAILESGQRLYSMIDEFLSISRMESGSLPLDARPYSLDAALRGIHANFKAVASAKGVSIAMDLDKSLPLIECDAGLMERALSNLVSNAIKFTPAGGSVVIAARPVEGFVEISVSDTGMGIPEDEMSRVFDMYYRAAGSSGTEGTGLGLAIVKAVAEAHGGSVTVTSKPDKGSAFIIRVPHSAARAGARRT